MMHTIIIFNEKSRKITHIEEVVDPVVDGNTITWRGGGLYQINSPFVVIRGNATEEMQVGKAMPGLARGQDVKSQLRSRENQAQDQIRELQLMTNFMLFDESKKDEIREMQKMINFILLGGM